MSFKCGILTPNTRSSFSGEETDSVFGNTKQFDLNNGRALSNGRGYQRDNNNKYQLTDLDATVIDREKSCKQRFSSQKICVTIVLLFLVVLVTVTVVVVLTKKNKLNTSSTVRFQLDEVLLGTYRTARYGVLWTTDDKYLHYVNRSYVEFQLKPSLDEADNPRVLLSKEDLDYGLSGILLSPNGEWVISHNKTKSLYRYSFYADYFVKDLRRDSDRPNPSHDRLIKIPTPEQDSNEQIRYATWANNGSGIIFVYKCNIFFIPTLDVLPLEWYQLTYDGIPKEVFNGVPDWVYEEEVLYTTNAIDVSKDGRYISFVQFNATGIPFFKFPIYGDRRNRYTTFESIAFPKAGVRNPTIQISIIDLQKVIRNETFVTAQPLAPPALKNRDHYYCVMKWSPDNKLFVQWLNRAQNETYCTMYEPTVNTGIEVENHMTTHGWIDGHYVKPYFSKNDSYYITLLPNGDFNHVAKVPSSKAAGKIVHLTEGEFLVTDLQCYDPSNEIIYFRSTEGSPRYRHVYSVDVNTKERKCISCGLIKDSDGEKCTYFSSRFSIQCSYAILSCEGPIIPMTYMINLQTNEAKEIISNNHVKEKLKSRGLPQVSYYTVESDGFEIPVKEYRPADFDENKQYPVLLDVYGGPGTQKVSDQFHIGFSQYFVSQDIIVIYFDARGTGYLGYKYMHSVYKRLGYYESKDAIAVARHMQEQKYVNKDKIAIWGWSYGGYYSAFVLAMAGNVIKTAVSVAPVTDWRYYDTVYTERYMGLPTAQDNLRGYENTSLMSMAEKFRGKNFLLVHGTADDNVHFQNSAQLASALVSARVKFRTQFYTDKRHGISSGGHVYYLIADFLMAHLREHGFKTNSTFGYQT